jgi:thiol-disulfide isomerase/thioredoxin
MTTGKTVALVALAATVVSKIRGRRSGLKKLQGNNRRPVGQLLSSWPLARFAAGGRRAAGRELGLLDPARKETPMRALRTSLAAAWLLGAAPALAQAQTQYTPAKLLEYRPSQPGVEYDIPDPATVETCKVEVVYNAKKKAIGYALRDSQGKLLRKYVDTRGEPNIDQWSYYQDGFEVYRDNDLDNDQFVDECRWLNTAGSRHALVSKNKITGWKRLSAEEASKVLVQALVSGDQGLLETVMATADELAALGVPKGEIERVSAAAAQRVAQVKALFKELVGWDKQTVWLRFDGTMPHVIPADASADLKGDLLLYENAVVFVGSANGQGDPSKYAYLQAGEMVKIGETWKFVELPHGIDPKNPIVANAAAQEGGIRAWLFREPDATPQNPQLAAALQELGAYDTKHSNTLADGDKRKLAEFYRGRIPLLRKVVTLSANDDDALIYNKQIADSLAAAYQTDLYPSGVQLLETLIGSGGKIASYATYRKIMAENALKAEQPGANPMALQKELLTNLESFLAKYGKSDEAPDVLLQLASFNEFNAEEAEARKYYKQLAADFPASDAGKKAAGALKRLDLVGKSIELKGTSLRGEPIDAAGLRGKTVLIAFWATWAAPAKDDLPQLLKTYQSNHQSGLEVIGVNLDNDKATLDAFLKETPLPWSQIFEPGGMDSRLANEFGIISLPTMFLVDAQGKVINRNIRTAAELDKQLEKLGLAKPVNAALGVK